MQIAKNFLIKIFVSLSPVGFFQAANAFYCSEIFESSSQHTVIENSNVLRLFRNGFAHRSHRPLAPLFNDPEIRKYQIKKADTFWNLFAKKKNFSALVRKNGWSRELFESRFNEQTVEEFVTLIEPDHRPSFYALVLAARETPRSEIARDLQERFTQFLLRDWSSDPSYTVTSELALPRPARSQLADYVFAAKGLYTGFGVLLPESVALELGRYLPYIAFSAKQIRRGKRYEILAAYYRSEEYRNRFRPNLSSSFISAIVTSRPSVADSHVVRVELDAFFEFISFKSSVIKRSIIDWAIKDEDFRQSVYGLIFDTLSFYNSLPTFGANFIWSPFSVATSGINVDTTSLNIQNSIAKAEFFGLRRDDRVPNIIGEVNLQLTKLGLLAQNQMWKAGEIAPVDAVVFFKNHSPREWGPDLTDIAVVGLKSRLEKVWRRLGIRTDEALLISRAAVFDPQLEADLDGLSLQFASQKVITSNILKALATALRAATPPPRPDDPWLKHIMALADYQILLPIL